MSEEIFLMDADAFLTPGKEYYRFAFAPGFWEQINRLAAAGTIKTIDQVTKEVCPRSIESRKDAIQQWYEQAFSGEILSTNTQPIVEKYADIIHHLHASDTYTDEAFLEWSIRDDIHAPWLIATAYVHEYTVISMDAHTLTDGGTGAPISKPSTPRVCRDLGVRCIHLFDMMEELDITL